MAVAAAWSAPALRAAGDSPAGAYQEALAHERRVREPGARPALDEIRSVIAAYESIEQRFPSSGYGDRAIWQAAGLAVEAYDRRRDGRDFETGVRLLRRLERRHGDSPLARRAAERRSQLDALARIAQVTAIEREIRDDVVRVLIGLDRDVAFRSERLDDPGRLFFDFPETDALDPFRNAAMAFEDGDGVAESIRLGRHPDRTTRVVIDTADADDCRVFTLYEPYRVVVDCDRPPPPLPAAPMPPAPDAASLAMARALMDEVHGGLLRALRVADGPAPLAAPADRRAAWPAIGGSGELSVARQLGLQVSRIVIDPGHGGHDPGAQSHGMDEARLVLDVAYRLEQRLLAQPGVEVILTRRDDAYVPLEARTEMANRAQADLFLSIHANASRNVQARGVETYHLNFSPDPAAERIAARENAAGGGTMKNLDTLLRTIAANSKVNESRDFAAAIQRSMVAALRRIDPGLPDLGVKQAPFIVLIGARMPSVLAEISFLTNRQDAALLSDDDYRDRIADALLDGILRYRRSLEPVVQLAQQD